MSHQVRKRLLAGSVVGVAALMLASSAWACATFRGQLVVRGNRGTNVVTAIGTSTSGMIWCPGYPIGRAKATRGGTVTVTMSANPSSSCQPGLKLDQGAYSVNYTNGAAFSRSDPTDKNNLDGSRAWLIDCANPPDPRVTSTLGALTIDAAGNGTGTFTLPTSGVVSGPTDEAAICVTDTLGSNGNQAPVAIV